jgi:nucleotide-binding universal stress UspA family protein
MRILIGVDGSPASLEAVRFTGRLVDPATDAVAVYFSPLELERKLLGRSRRIVDGAAAALFEEACSLLPAGFTRRPEMIASSKTAAVGLLESAEGWRADMLVVGGRGHGAIEGFLLGSVSRAVLHAASLPVLVVRGTIPADRGPKVLVCHHAASAEPVAAALGGIHWPPDTEGTVIAVAESLLAGPLPAWLERRVRDPDTAAIAQAWQDEHDAEVAALEKAVAGFRSSLPPAFQRRPPVVVQGNPGDKIIAHVKQDGTDLVVLGRTPADSFTRWLLGSTSEAVLGQSSASALIVPVERKP